GRGGPAADDGSVQAEVLSGRSRAGRSIIGRPALRPLGLAAVAAPPLGILPAPAGERRRARRGAPMDAETRATVMRSWRTPLRADDQRHTAPRTLDALRQRTRIARRHADAAA